MLVIQMKLNMQKPITSVHQHIQQVPNNPIHPSQLQHNTHIHHNDDNVNKSNNSINNKCSRHGGIVCSHIITNIDHLVHNDHYQCTGNNDNLKPSIGTNGEYCTCYKPQNNDLRIYQTK
eukprot:434623_1